MTSLNFISLQSFVTFGHVGNSAVDFTLKRLGANVWPIHTVLFSNHTGYPSWKGLIVESKTISDIFQGIRDLDLLSQTHGFISGYLGSVDTARLANKFIQDLKKNHLEVIICVDPVMGDRETGLFAQAGLPEFFKNEMIKNAHIITPNHFELEYLVGVKLETEFEMINGAKTLIKHSTRIVLITSYYDDKNNKNVKTYVVTQDEVCFVETPKLPCVVSGAGDMTSALFTYFYTKFKNVKRALEQTISRVYSIIEKSYEEQSNELLIVKYQDVLVNPAHNFEACSVTDLT